MGGIVEGGTLAASAAAPALDGKDTEGENILTTILASFPEAGVNGSKLLLIIAKTLADGVTAEQIISAATQPAPRQVKNWTGLLGQRIREARWWRSSPPGSTPTSSADSCATLAPVASHAQPCGCPKCHAFHQARKSKDKSGTRDELARIISQAGEISEAVQEVISEQLPEHLATTFDAKFDPIVIAEEMFAWIDDRGIYAAIETIPSKEIPDAIDSMQFLLKHHADGRARWLRENLPPGHPLAEESNVELMLRLTRSSDVRD